MATNPAISLSEPLILATDESTAADVGAALIRIACEDSADLAWPLLITGAAGEALRRIHRSAPVAVFVCVARSSVDASAAMLEVIHHRLPKLPQLAIASEHHDDIERIVRAAGASHYFALGLDADARSLRLTLEALNIGPPVQSPHAGRPPPRSRASPRLASDPFVNCETTMPPNKPRRKHPAAAKARLQGDRS